MCNRPTGSSDKDKTKNKQTDEQTNNTLIVDRATDNENKTNEEAEQKFNNNKINNSVLLGLHYAKYSSTSTDVYFAHACQASLSQFDCSNWKTPAYGVE